MVNPDGSPRAGLPSYSEILERPDLHKKAVMRDLMTTPEFCSVCHKAALPAELNGYKWLRAFSVYDEWQQSSWSRESALPFYHKDKTSTCQNCHMPLELSEDSYVAKDGKISSHRFPGANTAIPTYYSYSDQIEAVRKLMANSLNMDFVAVSCKHQKKISEISLIDGATLSVSPGDEITMDLVIQNRGIGHNLVPEQRDFYESWVEFTATSAGGKLLAHSGGLNQDGSLDEAAHSYTNRLIDRSGNSLFLHQVWNTRLKTYDNTIPSGRSDLVRYRFRVPDHISGSIAISATVRYRRFRQQYSDFILDRHSSYPILELGTAKLTLNLGIHSYQASPEAKQTLLRWNNYGIALLGQQQWWKAEDAFAQTTRIDRTYVDGYVNAAIAEFSKWIEARKDNPDGPGVFSLDNANASPEKFIPALNLLQEALALSPGYARALFYKGVILRLQNRLDEAMASLMEVVKQYPAMRQGHQELGYVLYLKKDYQKAAKEFEGVKDINPDDITACYYLSVIYPNLGEPRKAEENARLYATHRDDPNNYALNLDYIRTHPNETLELTPYHIHDK
jgi:tetratricopeptide (TPR) repeat protein